MRSLWRFLIVLCVSCDRAQFSTTLHQDAEVATREGRLPDAVAALERALDFDPEDGVARERLVLLQLRLDNPGRALALASSGSGLRLRSVRLRNARVVATLRALGLEDGLAEAKALLAVGALSEDSEREVLEALATESQLDKPSLARSAPLPERWLSAVGERLLQSRGVEPAARFFLARPERERDGAAGISLKQALLARAYQEDFVLTLETLAGLTQSPKSALEYVGRLEYARQRGDDAEAARLQPGREQLPPPYYAAWQLGLARMAARRGDWYGVLERTSGAPDEDARNEGRRQALRCVAHFELGDRAAARAQLDDWLSEPAAAQVWSGALLLPELRNRASDLVELRRAADRARAKRSPAR